MFEDKHMFQFVCALLGFASIIIPGPLIPILSFAIAIGLLIYKIKRAKESPEAFESLMLDIVFIVIVLVIDIGFFAMRISIEHEYRKSHYSSSSSQEISTDDFAEYAIAEYRLENFYQFSGDKNYQSTIRRGFFNYLKERLGSENISVKGNRITCNIEGGQIVFVITKNNIQYSVR